MTETMRDTYSEFASDNCAWTGDSGHECAVVLPPSFSVLCAEGVRDKVYPPGSRPRMCDCIILDSMEEKISLVELKSGIRKYRNLKFFKDGRHQLCEGLRMIVKILQNMEKLQVHLQIVLFSNTEFKHPSTQKEFMKHLEHPLKIRPIMVPCGSELPDSYESVNVPRD